MSFEMCHECGEFPVHIKKRGLCVKCYAKARAKNGPPAPTDSYVVNKSEIVFIKNFFEHSNWMYQPAAFCLNQRTIEKYTPDFYDGERNVFIEVVGSRQAYHFNKGKYARFKAAFPKIKVEFRSEKGTLIDTDAKTISWPDDVNSGEEVTP